MSTARATHDPLFPVVATSRTGVCVEGGGGGLNKAVARKKCLGGGGGGGGGVWSPKIQPLLYSSVVSGVAREAT